MSTRQVTNLITNHTYSNLVLRVPGVYAVRPPLEEPQYKALGDAHGGAQRLHQPAELGALRHHRRRRRTGASSTPAASASPSRSARTSSTRRSPRASSTSTSATPAPPAPARAATAPRTSRWPRRRSTRPCTARSPAPRRPGGTCRSAKTFTSETSPVVQLDGTTSAPLEYTDTLTSSLRQQGREVQLGGQPVDPPDRRRPLRPRRAGARAGRPSRSPTRAGIPAENTGDPLTGAAEKFTFTIGALPQYDNGTATVSMQWGSAATDWDLFVFEQRRPGRRPVGAGRRRTARTRCSSTRPPAPTPPTS